MNQAEVIWTLLIVVAALAILAKKVELPYPVLLVIGGLALGFVPGLPPVQLEPNLVFLFLLPPLLYPAALFTSWRDFRANLNAILLLAIGLVLLTTAFVAVVAHALAGLPWAAAFVLGAIISPSDAVAATAITSRLRVPRRIVTVLEGESLVNDATALVAYRFGIATMMSGTFSLSEAIGRFLLVALGGTGIGLAVGWLAAHIQRRLNDPPVQMTISLLTPFAAYIPSERFHVSGVLAVVAAGLFLGWRGPQILTARTRLNIFVFWEMIVFLLNGLVFVLIGLQLPRILHTLSGHSLKQLLWHGVLISCAAIVVRIAWVFASTNAVRLISVALRRQGDPYSAWQNLAIVAWTGMRGVVSLAAALAVPLTLSNGSAFPGRDDILFITFCVILATLVLQGMSLPSLIHRLGVVDDGLANVEERTARLKANEAALAYLAEVDNRVPPDLVERLRAEYNDRIRQLEVYASVGGDRSDGLLPSYQRLQQDALDVERRTIIRLRDEYVINDEVLRRIQLDLDHAEARLHVRE
jgi:monovalent cation/hydrogen antiporter